MNCIGIVGEAGSGKDTTAKLLQIELALRQDIFTTYAFAKPIYEMVNKSFRISWGDLENRSKKEVTQTVTVWASKFEFDVKQCIKILLMRYAQMTSTDLVELEFDLALKYSCKREVLYDNLYDIYLKTFYYQIQSKYPFVQWIQKLIYKDFTMKFDVSIRELLQKTGTEFFRVHIDENFWTIISPTEDVIFTDVRFPNEVNHILQNDGIIIKLTNPNLNKIPNSGHESESYINNLYSDHTLINDGKSMDNLIKNVEKLVKEIYEEDV